MEMTKEQKTIYAERILRSPDDGLMIVASILGHEFCNKNPLVPIALKDALPNDVFVLAELERLKNILPSSADYIREIHEKAKQAFERGAMKEYFAGMRLIAEIQGLIKKQAEDSSKSNDRLDELAAMVVPN